MNTTSRKSTRAPSSVPHTLVWLAIVLCAAGLVVSGYLTYEHYTSSTTLACPDTGRVNCAKVTSSQYSKLAGIPIALLGTLYFAVLLPLLTPLAWRTPLRWVRATRAATAGLGVAMAVYLVWAEMYRVRAICLWCTAVHAITFLILVVVVFAEALREVDRP